MYLLALRGDLNIFSDNELCRDGGPVSFLSRKKSLLEAELLKFVVSSVADLKHIEALCGT